MPPEHELTVRVLPAHVTSAAPHEAGRAARPQQTFVPMPLSMHAPLLHSVPVAHMLPGPLPA